MAPSDVAAGRPGDLEPEPASAVDAGAHDVSPFASSWRGRRGGNDIKAGDAAILDRRDGKYVRRPCYSGCFRGGVCVYVCVCG